MWDWFVCGDGEREAGVEKCDHKGGNKIIIILMRRLKSAFKYWYFQGLDKHERKRKRDTKNCRESCKAARTKDGKREKQLKSEFQILEIHQCVETDRIQQLLVVNAQRDRKPRTEAVGRHGRRVLAPGSTRALMKTHTHTHTHTRIHVRTNIHVQRQSARQ